MTANPSPPLATWKAGARLGGAPLLLARRHRGCLQPRLLCDARRRACRLDRDRTRNAGRDYQDASHLDWRVWKKLVLGGLMEAALGRAFNKVEDMRLLADYSAEPPPLDDAKWAVDQAGDFVEAMRAKFVPTEGGA